MNEAVIEAGESGAEATGWTQENLQKLLASLKDVLPKNDRTKPYQKGLKTVNWDKVAFDPFSASECRKKWKSMAREMSRYRSLFELLDEAEDLLSSPFCEKNIHPDLPKPPDPPKQTYIKRCMSMFPKKTPGVKMVSMKRTFSEDYEKLSNEKKTIYSEKYRLEFQEYSKKIQKFCKENGLFVPVRKKRHKHKRVSLEYVPKDTDFPQKPPEHGFNLFILENSARGTGREPEHGASFLRVMSQHWREMSGEEKEKYKRRCAEMKRQYKPKMAKYLAGLDEKKKKLLIEEKVIQVPKEILDQQKMPSELSGTEKDQYAETTEKNMRKYAEELQVWIQTLSQEEQKDYFMKNPDKVIFLQKYIDVKRKTLDPSSDEKTSTRKVATRASARLRARKDADMFKVHH